MRGYCPPPNNAATIALLRSHGWGILTSASYWKSHRMAQYEGMPLAIDNGAWGYYQRDEPFDDDAFIECLEALHKDAKWYVLPDVVAGGLDSLALSLRWLDQLAWAHAEPYLAVQDGMAPEHLEGRPLHIFVGGTTEYKLETMGAWANYAHQHNKMCHVGRVNSRKRMEWCFACDVDSFDGSGIVRFPHKAARTVRWLDDIRRREEAPPIRGPVPERWRG